MSTDRVDDPLTLSMRPRNHLRVVSLSAVNPDYPHPPARIVDGCGALLAFLDARNCPARLIKIVLRRRTRIATCVRPRRLRLDGGIL